MADSQKIVYASLPLTSMLDRRHMKKATALLQEAEEIREQIDTLKERYVEIVGGKIGKQEITGELERIQQEAELPGLRWGSLVYTVTQSAGRRTLDKSLLIENGVDPAAIAASYKEGKPFVTRVFKNLERDKGEGDE